MKADLVRIGNSRGVRIPKPLIEQCGLGETVDLRVENDCLVISPQRRPRQGWDGAFRAAALPVDNDLLLDLGSNKFDGKEWKW
jgi:antitoxin MazE